jgi:hypothetical protein
MAVVFEQFVVSTNFAVDTLVPEYLELMLQKDLRCPQLVARRATWGELCGIVVRARFDSHSSYNPFRVQWSRWLDGKALAVRFPRELDAPLLEM